MAEARGEISYVKFADATTAALKDAADADGSVAFRTKPDGGKREYFLDYVVLLRPSISR